MAAPEAAPAPQPALSLAFAVTGAERFGLAADVEGVARPRARDHLQGLGVECVETFHDAAGVDGAVELIEQAQEEIAGVASLLWTDDPSENPHAEL